MKSLHFTNAMTQFSKFQARLGFRGLCGRAAGRGFSLIETAIALGVVSFALISLLGMLPSGLQTFRKAMDLTVQKEMTQVLLAKANQTAFTDLSKQLVGTYYFDDNGDLLISDQDPTAVYMATVAVTSGATLPVDSTISTPTNYGMALVTITYRHKQAPLSGPAMSTVTTYIASMTGSSTTASSSSP